MKRFYLIGFASLVMLGVCADIIQAQEFPVQDNRMAQASSMKSPTLRDLSPVQLYEVPEISVEPPVPLPDPDALSLILNADNGKSLSARFSDEMIADLSYIRAPGSTLEPGSLSKRKKALVFSSLRSNEGWTLGTENWRFNRTDGLDLTLGSAPSKAPEWGNSARLGGIALSQSLSDGAVPEDEWQYSVILGALDYSPGPGTEGGLVFGPTASDTVVRYGLSRQLTIESQLQVAPDMLMTGVGGKYTTREWGAWSAGVANASQNMNRGWRYRVGYEVGLLDMMKLSWANEQRSGGYSDLTRYQDFSVDTGSRRNLWAATVPMGRWGDLKGSYEEVSADTGKVKQYFGLTQQFWYSPNLRIALKADREAVSGAYGVGVRFSIPIK